MKFESFIKAKKSIAMALSVEEYKSIRPVLEAYYPEKKLEDIDDFCFCKAPFERFLLCNPYNMEQIGPAMMLENAVTFIDRIGFSKVDFSGFQEELISQSKKELIDDVDGLIADAGERSVVDGNNRQEQEHVMDC